MAEQNSADNVEQLISQNNINPQDVPTTEKSADVELKEDLTQKEEEYESEEIYVGYPDVVIIDNGSYMVKVGTSDKKAPTNHYRCLVGTTKVNSEDENIYVDDIEEGKMDDYKLTCPLDEFGQVKERQQMGNFWNWMLKKYPEHDELKVLLTEPSHDLKGMNKAQENREKMMTLIAYGVRAIYIANEAQLALYSTGSTSGTVVDMGHSMTYITPVYEGFVLTQAVQMTDIAGSMVDEFLKEQLTNADWTGYNMQKHLKSIKQKHCKVSSERYLPSLGEESPEEYKLPDNKQIIMLKKDVLAQTPELFFNPSLLNKPVSSESSEPRKNINELILNAVRGTPAKIRQNVSDVVLCGGSSMFTGMVERFKNSMLEINERKDQSGEVPMLNVVAKPYRKYATWIGGSILANLEPFKDKWITKAIFDEEGGDRCVHKRIFW